MSMPQETSKPASMDIPRTEFLLEMYRQTSNHLNRHVVLLWQSVALLGGAYAAFAFQEKNVISIHHATTIALFLCGWFCANVYDAYAWFDRNLVIITNIERLFLDNHDATIVHPYFLKHRDPSRLVSHFEIHLLLGVMVAATVSIVHFTGQVLPSFKIPNGVFDAELALPYMALLLSLGYCMHIRHQVMKKACQLRKSSPGMVV